MSSTRILLLNPARWREKSRDPCFCVSRAKRAQAVQAEAIIWRPVRNRKCEGAQFQRQVPLGDYTVDFICFEYRLAVEIDGPSHEVAQQRLADIERDNWLRERGFRVLRLANEL